MGARLEFGQRGPDVGHAPRAREESGSSVRRRNTLLACPGRRLGDRTFHTCVLLPRERALLQQRRASMHRQLALAHIHLPDPIIHPFHYTHPPHHIQHGRFAGERRTQGAAAGPLPLHLVSRALHMLGQRLQMSPQAARQTRFGVLCSTSLARLCCSTSGRGSSRSPLRCTLALRRSAFCTPQLLLRCARCACRCCALSAQRLCRARCVFARDFSVCLCCDLARASASFYRHASLLQCRAAFSALHCSALLGTAQHCSHSRRLWPLLRLWSRC